MNPSMEPSQMPLVVFGLDHVDTTRIEILVQCLTNKIKEKRFNLQKLIGFSEDKKKRNELLEKENLQLTTTLANIEHENSIREQQLQSEQLRIKELQFNIRMLDEHNNSIRRDCMNDEQKYEQEKSLLINKFEQIKQQWTDSFKPQYEQSKVYQYLKQGDLAYNTYVERKEALLDAQKVAYNDYIRRRKEFYHEKKLQFSIISIAKYFIVRRDQLIKIENMKEKLVELERKQKQLFESKLDKMKAWETVYTQPVKRDLMNFCLQTNIDQALTLSFNQLQQDIWSQPMTPVVAPILTPQNEQIELVPEKQINYKKAMTFQLPTAINSVDETSVEVVLPSTIQTIASTIVVDPSILSNTPIQSNRTSVLHLTTAIDDDDDHGKLLSKSSKKLLGTQMEYMALNDILESTQSFTISATASKLNKDIDENVLSRSESNQSLTQAFSFVSTPLRNESSSTCEPITSITNNQIPESISISSTENAVTKVHSTVTFQLPPTISHIQPVISTTSSIQHQVTSNDVQQMLLTFSPDPPSVNEEQTQIMEDDSEQLHNQQRSIFPIPASIESTTSTDKTYENFNYNFGFDEGKIGEGTVVNAGNFTSPINFGNWSNLNSPITTDSNAQFPAFLQQTINANDGVDTSFSFASFNFCGLDESEAPNDGAFGSFFFGNSGSSMNTEHDQARKDN